MEQQSNKKPSAQLLESVARLKEAGVKMSEAWRKVVDSSNGFFKACNELKRIQNEQ